MSLPVAALTLQTMTMGAMSVQMVEILGEPWFYAPSLARTLEYKDARDMLRGVPVDEKSVFKINIPTPQRGVEPPALSAGGVKQINDANFVNEPGFYRVVMRSRSAVAEPFKKWVFHEVLPSIRKTGQYRVVHEAKRLGHRMDFTDAQWEWLKERPDCVDLIPLALAGYNSVQITRMLGYNTPSGITVRKQIEKLKELGFLPDVIEPRAKQLERRIKAELTDKRAAITV